MKSQEFLILLLLLGAAYTLAFGTGGILVDILARRWRVAAVVHWTERARSAFAPGYAVLWLAVVFPPLASVLGLSGLLAIDPSFEDRRLATVLSFWGAALAGVLTARFLWLRELWGQRVTLRSWVGGCLCILFATASHLLLPVLLFSCLPAAPDWTAGSCFAGSLVAMAFFVFGGGLLLLRALGLARPAPTSVSDLVQRLAREMNVPGRVGVFQLEWAQVNAIAWTTYRAIGFSRPLLDCMTPGELRAVAAHELAHLLEPRWVRLTRAGHMFSYLPLAPLVKYGGATGAIAGYVLFLAFALGYRRFGCWLEQRADRLEVQTIGNCETYLQSMIRLHQANMMPAVMPGRQTHPHLYDRLLAAGIQPDFPRPDAPARAWALLAMSAATLVGLVLLLLVVLAAGIWLRFTGGIR